MRAEEKRDRKIIEQSQGKGKFLSNAASLASGVGGAVAGGALISRMIPFLSNLIPAGLAVKGLSKLDPRIGNFFKGAFTSGFNIDEGLDYLRENIMPENPEAKRFGEMEKGYQDMQQGINEMQSQIDPTTVNPQAAQSVPFNNQPYPKGSILKKMLGDTRTQTNPLSQMSAQDSGDVRQQQGGQGEARLMAAIQQFRQIRGG